MMKLLLENWRSYTASILNEDLLIESYEQAQESVAARASKWFKGFIYNDNKQTYDRIEEIIKEEVVNEWGEDYNKAALEKIKQTGYIFHWDIAGYIILYILKKTYIPLDITDKQSQIALLWSYNQLISGNILNKSEIKELMQAVYMYIILKFKSSKKIIDLIHEKHKIDMSSRGVDFHGQLEDFFPRTDEYIPFKIARKNLIERFFQWNRFIRDGKRDLNAVVDYQELYVLVEQARPLYMAWQKKQEQKDAEAGKELLLDDDNWQVIAIHNKGAACQLGKGSDWCTAAPGLNYFNNYYKPNDPLFFIFDKEHNEKFQFHFGTKQFMDFDDNPLSEENFPRKFHIPRLKMQKEIMKVLVKVVPEKYDIAYDYLVKYRK
jgi:hypothetical protein